MASNSTISISYKLEESGDGFNKAIIKVEDLRNVLTSAVKEAEQLKSPVINFAALATGIDSINNTLSSLQKALKGLTDAYAAQVEAETQLAKAMRNNMGARESDIQSIKDLCSAQQELGVIGDEVQLAGAQELATYLSEKQSLEKLIPVMNDMLAQQYGLNATQENAAQIATMLGKVMDGQTSALSRYGYSFDDVQERILKYGSEAERAAVLTQVVESAVGGMNAELAQTDVGKQKQFDNTLGDIKEKLGGLANDAMSFITIAANATIALSGLIKLKSGIEAASAAVKGFKLGQTLTNFVIKATGLYSKQSALGLEMLRTSAKGSEKAVLGLKIAFRGLLIASAVGAAVWGVTKLIQAFTGASQKAAERQRELAEEQARLKKETEEWKSGLTNVSRAVADNAAEEMSALERLYSVAKDDTKSRKERADAISELKRQWPDYFNQISAEQIEINKLTKSYENAKKAILDLAMVKAIESKISENAGEKVSLGLELDDVTREYKEFEEIYDAVKKLKPDKSIGGLKFGDVKNALAGKTYKGEDAFRALQTGKFNTSGVAVLQTQHVNHGVQFMHLPEAMSAMNGVYIDKFKEIADKDDAVDRANDTLTERLEEAKKRVEGSIGNSGSGSTVTKPVFRENATKLKDIEENVRYFQAELENATIETAPEINANIVLWQKLADAIRNAGEESKKTVQEWHDIPATINEINENISILSNELNATDINDTDKVAKLNAQIAALQKQIDAIRKVGAEAEETEEKFKWHEAPKTLQEINDNIAKLQNDLLTVSSIDEAAGINRQIAALEELGNAYREAGKKGKSTFETLRDGYNGIKGIGGGVDSLTNALEGNANAWQTVTGIVDGFLQIYDGIRSIVEIIDMMRAATDLNVVSKKAETAATNENTISESANAVASLENTAAKSGEAVAEATASGAKLPFPMNIAAIAAGIAAVVGALGMIGCFASGGIVGGNSHSGDKLLARVNSGEMILNATQQRNLFGMLNTPTSIRGVSIATPDYAEVVAPLDKLRGMLNDSRADASPGHVEFEIRGDRLYGVLRRYERMRDRT